MAQSVATPWDARHSPKPGRLVLGLSEKSLAGIAVQPPENIERPVANWHQPTFIVFGSFFG
jgi:hypothetical protein